MEAKSKIDYAKKIQELKNLYREIIEKYDAVIVLTGDELMDLLIKTGSTSLQEQIKDIELDKHYKVSRKATRKVNVDRRIKQLRKENRGDLYIFNWLTRLVEENNKLNKGFINGIIGARNS